MVRLRGVVEAVKLRVVWERRAILRNPGQLEALRALAEEGAGSFRKFYGASARGELPTESYELYHGRRVRWIGYQGEMLKVKADYVRHIEGNIFSPDKLAAVVEGVDQGDSNGEKVAFYPAYGQATVIGLDDVRESIQYAADEGLDRPYTTGDDELDAYLVDPKQAMDDAGTTKAAFEKRLKAVVSKRTGDLGELAVTVRDGNHRAFGALLAGEPYIYVRLYDNDMQDIRDARKTKKWTKHLKAISRVLE